MKVKLSVKTELAEEWTSDPFTSLVSRVKSGEGVETTFTVYCLILKTNWFPKGLLFGLFQTMWEGER